MTNQEVILCNLLKCGTLDLPYLEGINYEVGDIVNEIIYNYGIENLSLNAIFTEVFNYGIRDLQEVIENAISNLENEVENDDELKEEFEDIKSLNTENDIEYYCNCLDTSIYFTNNENIYRKYFEDEISNIEYNMGFDF